MIVAVRCDPVDISSRISGQWGGKSSFHFLKGIGLIAWSAAEKSWIQHRTCRPVRCCAHSVLCDAGCAPSDSPRRSIAVLEDSTAPESEEECSIPNPNRTRDAWEQGRAVRAWPWLWPSAGLAAGLSPRARPARVVCPSVLVLWVSLSRQ